MGRVGLDNGRKLPPSCLGAVAAVLAAALLLAGAARAAHEDHSGGAEPNPEATHTQKPAAEPEQKNPLDHVVDHWDIELFESFGPKHIPLPHYTFFKDTNHPLTLGLSKFMLLELLAAVIVAASYIPLGGRLRSGELPQGWHTNLREVLLTFVRDDIAKPALGEHDADKYVPFLWTLFLFILANNLLGMIPFCGSATGNIFVTGGLALCAFFAIHGSAAAKMGFGHYVTSMWPHFDVPFGLGYVLKPMIFVLEWMGVLVRNLVLAVRLFANMFAGHVVLATILIFISVAGTAGMALWGTVTAASVLGQVALSLLELFVACLQAYIFTFLAAIFMGMAMHPAH